jgi:hypothetical protein
LFWLERNFFISQLQLQRQTTASRQSGADGSRQLRQFCFALLRRTV